MWEPLDEDNYDPLIGNEPIANPGSIAASNGSPTLPQDPFVESPATSLIGQHPHEFISGTAGTGKTFAARAYAEAHAKSTVLCASTGIAAINLGGTTINALLGYFDTASLQDNFLAGRIQSKLRALKKAGLRRIILDEVSMVDGRQLTILTRALNEVNEGKSLADVGNSAEDEDYDPDEPAEPTIGLTLVGDFGQLPPVPDTDQRTNKKIPATFAFESPEWPAHYGQHVTKLTEVKRQDSKEFVAAIHAVRRGDVDHAREFFGPLLSTSLDDGFAGSTIVAKNDTVDRYNQLRLDQLTTDSHQFFKSSWGKQRGEWKQIPETLILKAHALVMVLSNKRDLESGDYEYVNGDLGELVGLTEYSKQPVVRLVRTGEDVVVTPTTRSCTIPLEVGRRKELREQGLDNRITEDGKYEIVGQVTYVPLRVAYATTVHKSQGLSLDLVQIDLRDHFFASPGMLFVALSRARTAEGLRLVGNVDTFVQRCTVNRKVAPWL
jgi:ATP-dependent DNA helicase PIF1